MATLPPRKTKVSISAVGRQPTDPVSFNQLVKITS